MKKLFSLSSILLASSVNAAVVTSGPVDLGYVQIINDANPRVYLGGITLDGAAIGCENNIPVIPLDSTHAETMYKTILAAKQSGQKVQLVASKCWELFSTPVVYSVYVY